MKSPRLGRRTLVPLTVVALLIAAYAFTVSLANRYYVVAAPASSAYSASPDGFKVYFTYLEELGHEPEMLQSLEDLPKDATIISAAPYVKEPSPADAETLGRWVRAGGRLVAVGGDARELLDPMGFGGSPNSAEPSETLRPLFPGAYAEGIEGVEPGPDRLLLDASAWVAHFKDYGGQLLVSRKVGNGEVVWLAGPLPLSNKAIGRADNGKLAVALATAGGRPVYFDEYHHGYVSDPGFWRRMQEGGRSAVLLLGAALGIALLAWGRRLGPPIPAVHEAEARGGAYIGQLAELYRKAGARGEALASLEEGLTRALVRTHGTLDAGLRHHPAALDAIDASRSLREADGIAEDAFVTTARRLAAARQEVEGNG